MLMSVPSASLTSVDLCTLNVARSIVYSSLVGPAVVA